MSGSEIERWDPARWRLRAVVRRVGDWVDATAARRRIFWFLVITLVLVVIPVLIGAVATAHAASLSGIDGVGWTNVRDSAGVPLSDYLFATNHGSLLHPDDTAVSTLLGLEFTGFMVIAITAIWMIGYALSFRWLAVLDHALTTVSGSLTQQVATPLVLAVAATIGATIVAWFVVREQHAKAAIQVVTTLGVAIAGVTYLAHPLADVLSPHGVLAQGRDLGVSVAAGLNGNAAPNAGGIVTTLESTLADNFVRHPVQVWNFGHVVDNAPGCRSAWSAGVLSGEEGRVARGMANCGDAFAHAKTEDPTLGQVGTGVVLLIFATILLLFGVYLAGKIFLAALEAIYHAMMAIFGFAAGGFIYGPTQTFLVRNLVNTAGAGLAMVAYTIFLGVYALLLDDVFQATPGEGMQVIFIGGLLMIGGIMLLRRLDFGLISGDNAVVNGIAAALAGQPAPAMSPTGSGMGPGSLRHALSPAQLSERLTHYNDNVAVQHLFRRVRPFSPYSHRRKEMELDNMATARDWHLDRNQIATAARAAARLNGGVKSPDGAAAALQRMIQSGGSLSTAESALRGAGFTDRTVIDEAIRAYGELQQYTEAEPSVSRPVTEAAAAMRMAAQQPTPANLAALRLTARRWQDDSPGVVGLDPAERAVVDGYLRAPNRDAIQDIARVATGRHAELSATHPPTLRTMTEVQGRRILAHLGAELSGRYLQAVERQDAAAAGEALNTATMTDMWSSGLNVTPWSAPLLR